MSHRKPDTPHMPRSALAPSVETPRAKKRRRRRRTSSSAPPFPSPIRMMTMTRCWVGNTPTPSTDSRILGPRLRIHHLSRLRILARAGYKRRGKFSGRGTCSLAPRKWNKERTSAVKNSSARYLFAIPFEPSTISLTTTACTSFLRPKWSVRGHGWMGTTSDGMSPISNQDHRPAACGRIYRHERDILYTLGQYSLYNFMCACCTTTVECLLSRGPCELLQTHIDTPFRTSSLCTPSPHPRP